MRNWEPVVEGDMGSVDLARLRAVVRARRCGGRRRGCGLAGLRADAPSEARGVDGERAGPTAPGTPACEGLLNGESVPGGVEIEERHRGIDAGWIDAVEAEAGDDPRRLDGCADIEGKIQGDVVDILRQCDVRVIGEARLVVEGT